MSRTDVAADPFDTCECGDYRWQHHDLGCEVCSHGTPPPDGANGCRRFRLASPVVAFTDVAQWRPGQPVPPDVHPAYLDADKSTPKPTKKPLLPWVLGVDAGPCGTGLHRTALAAVAYQDGAFDVYTWVAATEHAGGDLTDRVARLVNLRNQITTTLRRMRGAPPLLALVEAPSYGSTGADVHENIGAWWATVTTLVEAKVPVGTCDPQTRAKWACGNGRADKPAVIAALRRMWPDVPCTRVKSRTDECDALTLASTAGQYLGWPVPAHESLKNMHWPPTALTTTRSPR